MKKMYFAILAIAALSVVSCSKSDSYTVKGKISGNNEKLAQGKAYMYNMDRTEPIRDTADVINGEFVFEGSVTTPEMYSVVIDGVPGRLMIFLENDDFTITGTDTTYVESVVTGGPAQTMLNTYNDYSKNLAEEYDIRNVVKKMRHPNSTEEESETAYEVYTQYNEALENKKSEMIAENPVSHFALMFLSQDALDIPLDSAQAAVEAFKANPEYAENRILARTDVLIQKELSLQVGCQAPDFTLNDPNGNPITLSDIYKENKVTMIDFWASWCGPCRNFNPTLVKIYKQFHKKGFEILGVSLDRDAESWKAGIKDDKLTWPHVSDLKYWQSEAASMYNVKYIPQSLFVDSEGKILARRLSEEEIVPFLEEQLGK